MPSHAAAAAHVSVLQTHALWLSSAGCAAASLQLAALIVGKFFAHKFDTRSKTWSYLSNAVFCLAIGEVQVLVQAQQRLPGSQHADAPRAHLLRAPPPPPPPPPPHHRRHRRPPSTHNIQLETHLHLTHSLPPAAVLEISTYPAPGSAVVALMCLAAVSRSVAMLTSGATRSVFNLSLARNNNIGGMAC